MNARNLPSGLADITDPSDDNKLWPTTLDSRIHNLCTIVCCKQELELVKHAPQPASLLVRHVPRACSTLGLLNTHWHPLPTAIHWVESPQGPPLIPQAPAMC
uniref:Uncharacterized protein n=1 Tax=Eutreptiella gymnastica TaxID=73025 RepID=A0A7S1NLG0_9EUGL